MELKDVVLSTLAEMEDDEVLRPTLQETQQEKIKESLIPKFEVPSVEIKEIFQEEDTKSTNDELHFLTSVRERLLVLFEGFQAPNNKEIEAKIDMTLNFLEYTLATIDKRVEKLQEGDK